MPKIEPILAQSIQTTAEELVIILSDKEVRIPWEKCSPILAAASGQQRCMAELSPSGYGIHWPTIDEDLSVSGLIQKFDP